MALSRPSIAACRLLLGLAIVITTYFTTADITHTAAEEVNDKLAHILSFFVLALLADFSFPKRRFSWAVWVPLILYGLSIEIIQYHLPYRTFSLLDLAANATGIFAYGLSIPLLSRLPFLSPR